MSLLDPSARKAELEKALADLPPDLAADHLGRVDPEYLVFFTVPEIRSHLESLRRLSPENPCDGRIEEKEGLHRFTIVGYDYPGIFAVISGLLTVYGFDIRFGRVFTQARSPEPGARRPKIIDYLEAVHSDPSTLPGDLQADFCARLSSYFSELQAKRQDEARHRIHKEVGAFLSSLPEGQVNRWTPVEIGVEQEEGATVLHISGSDTPAFLFSLAHALALKGISIQKLRIETRRDTVIDVIHIVDRGGKPIIDPVYLGNLKAAIVLIKQFILFLPLAPDFDLAVRQFDRLLDELISHQVPEWDLLQFSDVAVLSSLAKALGSGPYFWEEFMRSQHQNILPLLKNLDLSKAPRGRAEHLEAMRSALSATGPPADAEEKARKLNAYIAGELFRIDMVHLVYPFRTFFRFSEELTELAESAVEAAAGIVLSGLDARHGRPMLENGRPCRFAVLALGKFGGRELGYASDLELVVLYEGYGLSEGGPEAISSPQFFNAFVQGLLRTIRAKQAGIFEIDLRLRPFGEQGDPASSFKTWQEYFSPGGNAYDYERQALIKLRPVLGDADFCAQILTARDAVIYGSRPVDIGNTLELRRRQLQELVRPGRLNAKYSEGGLVDLEYAVQFLQLLHGPTYKALREPNTERALERLLENRLLTPGEFERLFNAYVFLRRLIDALRMVRGNARDLEIPPAHSDEFQFLAKRMGYIMKRGRPAWEQLAERIGETMGAVHAFFAVKFTGRPAGRQTEEIGLPEVVSRPDLPEQRARPVLEALGVEDVPRSIKALRGMHGRSPDPNTLLAVLVLAQRFIRNSPDPDKVILNLERYLEAAPPEEDILRQLLFYPRYLEILILVFGYSDFLSNLLLNEPYLIRLFSDEAELSATKSKEAYRRELAQAARPGRDFQEALERLRKVRNRELLRIGLRDLYLEADLLRITREISNLTDALLEEIFQRMAGELKVQGIADRLAVIAFGKLGGRELNYSSDIDIAFVLDDGEDVPGQEAAPLIQGFLRALTEPSPLGRLFRVDLDLRPYGGQGAPAATRSHYLEYYRRHADGWELPVWLKARSLAGSHSLGNALIRDVQELMLSEEKRELIFASLARLRLKMLEKLRSEDLLAKEVKSGPGGLRTIEFFLQRMQIGYGASHPGILTGNTLRGLLSLHQARLLSYHQYRILVDGYVFLRKIEHRIQMMDLQQRHELPAGNREMTRLAKRMGFEDKLHESALQQFLGRYRYYLLVLSDLSNEIFPIDAQASAPSEPS